MIQNNSFGKNLAKSRGDDIIVVNEGNCQVCGSFDILGNGYCMKCWDDKIEELDREGKYLPVNNKPAYTGDYAVVAKVFAL